MNTKLPKTIFWNGGIYELEMAFSKKHPDSFEHEWRVRYVRREDINLSNQRAIIDSEWEGTSLKKIEKEVLNWIKWQNAQEVKI